MPLDEIGHAVLRTSAVHHLLRRVVGIGDVRPRDIPKVLAPLQLAHGLARLQRITMEL